jgi:polar amino acid transport system permease protein
MRTCAESLTEYGLRALGRDYGAQLLPKGADISLCDQIVLIGSGMIWNVYFAVLAVTLGFGFATLIALAKASPLRGLRAPATAFIFVFRGSPLFIQFFFAYETFQILPKVTGTLNLGIMELSVTTGSLTRAWLGALIVLFLNTSAYTAEIFYGALRSVPKGDMEAADAYGLTGWARFRRITWPTMLRLSWPSYTNEAIFLFHATTLVFFSGFPAWQQSGDALYYARYFADQTFNPFVAYPIIAAYFILATLGITALYGAINRRLNRHLPREARPRLRFRPQIIR